MITSVIPLAISDIAEMDWGTDPETIRSFRATIASGIALPPLQVNRLIISADEYRFEVIDGFHRLDAYRAEEISMVDCQVVELDERTAMYARIQASLGKPNDVLINRAMRALRLSFVQDMIVDLRAIGPYAYRTLGDDGGITIKYRRHIPENPMAALGVIYEHLLAGGGNTYSHDGREAKQVDEVIRTWLDDIGRRFGKDRKWMREKVFTAELLVDSEEFDTFERYDILWRIPDEHLRKTIRDRMLREARGTPSRGDVRLIGQIVGYLFLGNTERYTRKQITSLLERFPTNAALVKELDEQFQRETYQAEQKRSAEKTRKSLELHQKAQDALANSVVTNDDAIPFTNAASEALRLDVPDEDLQSVVFTAVAPRFVKPGFESQVKRFEDEMPQRARNLHEAVKLLSQALQDIKRHEPDLMATRFVMNDLDALRIVLKQQIGWSIRSGKQEQS